MTTTDVSSTHATFAVRGIRFNPRDHACDWMATLTFAGHRVATLTLTHDEKFPMALDAAFDHELAQAQFLKHAQHKHPEMTIEEAAEEELAILIYDQYQRQAVHQRARNHTLFLLRGQRWPMRVSHAGGVTLERIGALKWRYGRRLETVFGSAKLAKAHGCATAPR